MSSLELQCLLGMACKDFCIMAADMTNTQSIFVTKNDEDKINEISSGLMIGAVGDTGDRAQFTQFVLKNLHLYYIRNQYHLDTKAAVHFIRKSLADGLRNQSPSYINMLLGGYDPVEGGQLYIMDFLAACVRVPYAAHGFSGQISVSILEDKYRPTLTENEAYEIMKLCVHEIHERCLINLTNFQVKIVSKKGITTMPVVSPETFFKG